MKNQSIPTIAITALTSLTLVFVLYVRSDKDSSYKHASFERNVVTNNLQPHDTIDLAYNSYYIAGSTSNHVYLGNTTVPFRLLAINTNTGESQKIKIDTRYVAQVEFRSFTITVDSPFFYMADGTMPTILRGDIGRWQARRPIFDSIYFVDFQPIDSTVYAVKSLSSISGEHALGKVRTDTSHAELFATLLEKQIDGRFCTDGEILYDRKTEQLVYVYRYRNEFFVMDKQLALAYRSNTVDSISKAQIHVATISSENSLTMSAPGLVVNKTSSVSNGLLYVHSNIMAKNENKETFDKVSTIDVYNLTKGKYMFSFYIPNYDNLNVRNFIVGNKKLICLYEHHAVIYEMKRLREDKKYFTCKVRLTTKACKRLVQILFT